LGLSSVMMIDVLTFTLAISMLFYVDIPQPAESEAGYKRNSGIWKDSIFGFHYIIKRTNLLGLQLILFSSNLISSLGETLATPMILARTGNSSLLLRTVMACGGIGGMVGSVVQTVWVEPKRKIHGVLGGMY